MYGIIIISHFLISFSSDVAWDQCEEFSPLRNLVNEKFIGSTRTEPHAEYEPASLSKLFN